MAALPKDKARRIAALRVAWSNLSLEPIEHPRFVEAFEELELVAESSQMVLLLGVSGTGKSYMSELLVKKRCADPLRPLPRDPDDPDQPNSRLAAAYVTAPSSQRGAFSWKAMWRRSLKVIHGPVPGATFDHWRCANALRDGVTHPGPRLTEPQLFEKVCEAAADRGLELLVIDEACSMLKSDAGRTLADQLDVLRELADVATFTVVLVSTFRIVQFLHGSSELNRRLSQVVLHRYVDTADTTGYQEDYDHFCRTAASLMERIPDWARMRLGKVECRRLYNGSLGCVGVLSDWWKRALLRCAKGGRALTWRDFEATALDAVDRAGMERDAEISAEYLALRGGSQLDCAPSNLPEPPQTPVWDTRPARGSSRTKSSGISSGQSRTSRRRKSRRHPVK